MRNRACCARLVDVGGMKYIFPLLAGKESLLLACPARLYALAPVFYSWRLLYVH